MNPVLVAAFPAAASTRCRESAELVAARLRQSLRDTALLTAYLDGGPVGLPSVMERITRPSVVVPMLALPSGAEYAAVQDAAALAGPRVDVVAGLGPHPLLARATLARLHSAGARWGDAAVLVSLPGADAAVRRALARSADLLADEWGPRVSVAALGEGADSVGDAVAEWHAGGIPRVFVVPQTIGYAECLPALRTAARAAGATAVTDPLGAHRQVIELAISRYEQARVPLPRGAVSAA